MTNQQDGLAFNFTGRISVVVELEEFSPIELRADDKEIAKDVVRAFLRHCTETDVHVQSKKQTRRLKKLLENDE